MNDSQKVRVLIGDQAKVTFTDDEIQFFLEIGEDSIYMASALACDAQAAKIGTNLKEFRIGDYQETSGRNQVTALQNQAEAFRNLEYDTPAFAIGEENLSSFSALEIIRNYVLRTNP